MGMPGASNPCLWAVDTIVNSQSAPRKASVVTWMKDRHNLRGEHLFLFWDWNWVPLTVVHSGFASGYPGTAPKCFSAALSMIKDRAIPINEVFLDEFEFYSIENRKLTSNLIESLSNADDRPATWFGMTETHWSQVEGQTFWAGQHEPKMIFDFIDPEISMRCRNLYSQDPEAAISRAFVVVEERMRRRITTLHGQEGFLSGNELISRALNPKTGLLTDQSLSPPEREGMFFLFRGAFQFVRNPRAHRVVGVKDKQLDVEFIYLADLLLRILPEATSDAKSAEDESNDS